MAVDLLGKILDGAGVTWEVVRLAVATVSPEFVRTEHQLERKAGVLTSNRLNVSQTIRHGRVDHPSKSIEGRVHRARFCTRTCPANRIHYRVAWLNRQFHRERRRVIRHLPESCRVKAAGKSRESPLVRSHNGRFLRHRPERSERCLNYKRLYQCPPALPKWEGVPKALA